METEQKIKNTPVLKDKSGHFQLSIWKQKRIIPAKNDFDVEREVESVRTCIQMSRFNKINKTWENQTIWCFPEDLRDLAILLSKINLEDSGNKAAGSS